MARPWCSDTIRHILSSSSFTSALASSSASSRHSAMLSLHRSPSRSATLSFLRRRLHSSSPSYASSSATSHYDTLGIPSNSSKRDIKNKFYELSKKSHPDLPGGDRDRFEQVSEAYSVLGDDAARRQYDNSLSAKLNAHRPSSSYHPHYRPQSPYLRRDHTAPGPHRAWNRPHPSRAPPGPEDVPPGYHFTSSRRARQPPNFGSGAFHDLNAGPGTGGFGRRSPQSGTGGLGRGSDPNLHQEVRNESGIGRFIGVFALLMLVIGLGGGFTVKADEKDVDDDAARALCEEVWRPRIRDCR